MLIAALAALWMGPLGPGIGSTVPELARFEPLMGEEGATIVFVRSIDWCPYCKSQVQELAEMGQDFAEEGKPLVFVSYDTAAKQAAFSQNQGIEARFIADEGSELIEAFGLLNENHRPGSRAYGIPHPAVIIIDEEGVVEAKLYEEGYVTNDKSYRNRPAAETILDAVRGR
jgi:peroxiredoxin